MSIELASRLNRIRVRRLTGAAILCSLAWTRGPAPIRTGVSAPVPAPESTLVAIDSVDQLDVVAREPMLAEHPNGTIFVAGYGLPGPKLWKSHDHGRTWDRVNVGSESNGAIGNSDVDLAIARDGTIYFVTMAFDRKLGEGIGIAVGVSRDAGASWTWHELSKARFDDRPWIAVAPNGTVHAIWNDGSGVRHSVSADRGATWKELPRISTAGGSSHLAVGPNGELAVRLTPASASGNVFNAGVDSVVVSSDGGVTWQRYAAPGEREWSPPSEEGPVPRWVEPLAWDARGALYSLWTNRGGLWLARSLDAGKTWKSWRIAQSAQLMYYPYLVGRENGELAASWFSGFGDTLHAHVARVDMGSGNAPPRVIEARAFQPDSWGWSARKGDPNVRETAGEYLAIAFLNDGSIGAVTPIQNERAQRFGFSWRRLVVR